MIYVSHKSSLWRLNSVLRSGQLLVRHVRDHPNAALLIEPDERDQECVEQSQEDPGDNVQNVMSVQKQSREAHRDAPGQHRRPQNERHRVQPGQEGDDVNRSGNVPRGEAKLVRPDAERIVIYGRTTATSSCLDDRHHYDIRDKSDEEIHLHLVPLRFVDHPAEGEPSGQPSDSMARVLQNKKTLE